MPLYRFTDSKLLLFSVLLAVFAFVPEARAAVTSLGSPTFTTNTNTHSFTVPAGADRILLVVASDDDSVDISTVSFGISPMTQRAEHTDGAAVDSIWTLNLGTNASPTTATITVVSTSGTPNNSSFIAAAAFQGVNQTTPVSGVQMANNNTVQPVFSTLNIVSAAGNLVFDIFDVFKSGAPVTTVTPGGSQSIVHNGGTTTLGSGGLGFYRTSTRPGAASVPMSWTTSAGEAHIQIALNINAVPTAANVSVGGRVFTADGRGIRGAIVSITDGNGSVRTTQTGTFGYYFFDDIEVGRNYTLQVYGKKYSFSNPAQIISVKDQIADADFIADSQ